MAPEGQLPEQAIPTDETQIASPLQDLSPVLTARRIKKDFETAENYRRTNHDWRWNGADLLYFGWKPQKYWEGTKVPRANLSVYLVNEHVESALPEDVGTLFGETYWFDARPYPSTSIDEARAVQELLLAQYRTVNKGTGAREVFRRASKSARLYGNGIIFQGWDRRNEVHRTIQDELVPEMVQIQNPQDGSMVAVPTGKTNRRVFENQQEVMVNELALEYVSLRDFYIDPNCPSPFPWDAEFCIRRKLVPIRKLSALRGQPNYNIPSDEQLYAASQMRGGTGGEHGTRTQEAMRGVNYSPGTDYATAGESKRVEVLEYWTEEKLVWLIGREHIALDIPNPYSHIPFYNIYYEDVLDRFYAMGQSDILEPEQHLQEDLINGRLDELALNLHPPLKRKRGDPIPLSQLRWRPGLVTETEDPEKSLIREEARSSTNDAHIEVAASEARAQRRDGITELASLGTPGQGSNVNRTAFGIQTQVSASRKRTGYYIENIQEGVIVPMLDRALMYNQKWNSQNEVMEFLGQQGQLIQLTGSALVRAQMKFEMRASNKANSRSAMLGVLPLVTQTLVNPVLLEMLHAEGKTVEIDEIVNMILDATNYRGHKSSLIRPLTPEEQQMLAQAGIDQNKIMTQRIRGETQLDVTQERASGDLVQTLIEELMKRQTEEMKMKQKASQGTKGNGSKS